MPTNPTANSTEPRVGALLSLVDDFYCVGSEAETRDRREHEYGPDWYRFWRWCDERGAASEALPVAAPLLAEWCAWALDRLPDRTTAAVLAAIQHRHIAAGFGDHVEDLDLA